MAVRWKYPECRGSYDGRSILSAGTGWRNGNASSLGNDGKTGVACYDAVMA